MSELRESPGRRLLQASGMGDVATVARLLQAGVKPDEYREPCLGWTALHKAVVNGREDVVPILLQYGASPVLVDTRHNTALHWAAWGDQARAVRDILGSEQGAQCLAIKNQGGHTPGEYASAMGNDLVAQCIHQGEQRSTQERTDSSFLPGNSHQPPLYTSVNSMDDKICYKIEHQLGKETVPIGNKGYPLTNDMSLDSSISQNHSAPVTISIASAPYSGTLIPNIRPPSSDSSPSSNPTPDSNNRPVITTPDNIGTCIARDEPSEEKETDNSGALARSSGFYSVTPHPGRLTGDLVDGGSPSAIYNPERQVNVIDDKTWSEPRDKQIPLVSSTTATETKQNVDHLASKGSHSSVPGFALRYLLGGVIMMAVMVVSACKLKAQPRKLF